MYSNENQRSFNYERNSNNQEQNFPQSSQYQRPPQQNYNEKDYETRGPFSADGYNSSPNDNYQSNDSHSNQEPKRGVVYWVHGQAVPYGPPPFGAPPFGPPPFGPPIFGPPPFGAPIFGPPHFGPPPFGPPPFGAPPFGPPPFGPPPFGPSVYVQHIQHVEQHCIQEPPQVGRFRLV